MVSRRWKRCFALKALTYLTAGPASQEQIWASIRAGGPQPFCCLNPKELLHIGMLQVPDGYRDVKLFVAFHDTDTDLGIIGEVQVLSTGMMHKVN